MDNVKCLTPWDVQSRQIFDAEGAWYTLYAGDGGGKGYVMYGIDDGNHVCTMSERQLSMMVTMDVANTITATDYKGSQLICYERY